MNFECFDLIDLMKALKCLMKEELELKKAQKKLTALKKSLMDLKSMFAEKLMLFE